MEEYLYCVLSQEWGHCKLGMWKGYYRDLWARYGTVLGPDITDVVVFKCSGRRALEKVLLGYVRKLHISGEVYEKEAFTQFLELGSIVCDDSVPMPTTHRAKEIRKHVAAVKREGKRQKEDFLQRERQNVNGRLCNFILHCCHVSKGALVDTTEFRRGLAVGGFKLSPSQLKAKMKERGFDLIQKRIGHRRHQLFTGLSLRTNV